MQKLKTKKGMTLSNVPAVVMMLVIVGMLAGAGALALSKFQTSLTVATTEYLAVGNATKSIGNMAEQLPTVGTIIGVAIIIAVVIGAFYAGTRIVGER